ncbi:MAG: M1 family metallopeptidase [Saprospiraceae bacterium]|nr:M1 family metallopeptidase [Lewinella sp.]
MNIWKLQILICFGLITISDQQGFSYTDPYPKNPNIDAINYRFEFELSDDSDEIIGQATVDVRFLTDGITTLRLDLINRSDALKGKGMSVNTVKSNGKPVVFHHENDVLQITLPTPSEENQRIRFSITYRGIPATGLLIGENKYGDRTFFSDNWPNKGRNWLPVIDHPYDKATCEFVVTAPAHYQVVSNGLLIEETDLGTGKRRTHWKQSVPIAPWLYVLGVAKFAVQQVDEFQGKAIQTWVYYQDRDAGFYDFAEPTKKVLEFYSDYVGPFVYEKLANIQSNSVGGGMEAASAILYGSRSVTGQRSERWRNVVIHEIAHQWFGNSVTEYDWDDVWLSEGFATYFTLLFIEHEYGRDAFLEGLRSSKKTVDNFYAKDPGYRIVHDNLQDMSKVTTAQTYQKGSWTLHMLRGVVGTDNFWRGIQSYYRKHMNDSATTADFRREMEEASGQDLSVFFEQWLYKGGALQCAGSWKYDAPQKQVTLSLDQVQQDGSLFEMPIQVGLYFEGQESPQIEVIQLKERSNVFSIEVETEPSRIVLDPDTWVLMDVQEFGKTE